MDLQTLLKTLPPISEIENPGFLGAVVLLETRPKAIRVRLDASQGGPRDLWIPKRVCARQQTRKGDLGLAVEIRFCRENDIKFR